MVFIKFQRYRYKIGDGNILHLSKMKGTQTPIKTNFYYGWVIVAIAGLGVFFSGPGQTYSNSVFIDSYIQDFGWSRSLVSSIYSTATLFAGLLLFFAGRFIDKFGQRKMSVFVGLGLGIALLWNSIVSTPIMLFFGFFLIRLLGQGSMTLIPNTLVPQWFIQKRGRALSFMTTGGFLSSATFPPINEWMIRTWGWPTAWRVWSMLLIFLFVPLAYFFIRNRPENVGLKPDGLVVANQGLGKISDNDQDEYEINWTLKEAIRTKSFWLILFAVAIPSMINTGITFHLLSILGENQISSTASALILSLMAIMGLPVAMVAGFVLERVRSNIVLAFVFMGELIFLFILQNTYSIVFAILFGVIWGIVGGFERITLNIIWPNYFGRKHIGSIKGIAMTATVLGSAFGPLPFGIAYDTFGGYAQIIYIMMLFPVFGIIASLIATPPQK